MRHGFLSLKGFWIQERVSTFSQRTLGLWGPLSPWANTARLGPRILYHTSWQELQAPRDCGEDSRSLSTSRGRLDCFSLSLPFPARTWGYHGHRNRRTRMQSYFLPLSALPPPFCKMHSYNSRYKIKKQWWPHMGPFFFLKKEKNPTTSS